MLPKHAMTSPKDEKAQLLAELEGQHGSGLLARLGGAQRMKDAGRSISNDVAAQIDNEAVDWIKRAAAILATPKDEKGAAACGELTPARWREICGASGSDMDADGGEGDENAGGHGPTPESRCR